MCELCKETRRTFIQSIFWNCFQIMKCMVFKQLNTWPLEFSQSSAQYLIGPPLAVMSACSCKQPGQGSSMCDGASPVCCLVGLLGITSPIQPRGAQQDWDPDLVGATQAPSPSYWRERFSCALQRAWAHHIVGKWSKQLEMVQAVWQQMGSFRWTGSPRTPQNSWCLQ